MAAGGINDQLGGGFYRYAVDEYWMTPHFEKMLYDNAGLLAVYAQAALARGDALRAGRVKSFGPTLLVQAYGMQPNGFHGYVFQSSDGGSTWTYLADLSRPLDVTFVTATRWIEIVGHMESTDSGRTWHPFTSDYHSQAAGAAPQVVFADPLIGYATVRSDIQRTIDGGAHWTHIRTPGM